MEDIIVTEGPLAPFIEMAKVLGYTGLVVVGKKRKYKGDFPIRFVSDYIVASDKVRRDIEMKRGSVIYALEKQSHKDYLHHRGSGLNQVLAKLLASKDVAMGLGFSVLLHATPLKRARYMGRIRQNIRLCQKYNARIVVGSFATRPYEMRARHDLLVFYKVLGLRST